MILPIALTTAGAAALIHIWLGFRCGQVRGAEKISIGHGGSALLETRMRAHANYHENMPLFLILLALVEAAHGTNLWLWSAAILMVFARILHGIGMERTTTPFRAIGTIVSLLLLIVLAGYAVAIPYLTPSEVVTAVPAG
jgi:uncharacterized membrane protein YecN with MAPEG domain